MATKTRVHSRPAGVTMLIVLACLASVLPLAAPVAWAGDECPDHPPAGTQCAGATTSIRYREESNRFAGRVESRMTFCERRRVIALRREQPGADVTIATTRTGRSGRWVFRGFDDPEGRFYAVARHRERGFGIDAVLICLRAESRTIKV